MRGFRRSDLWCGDEAGTNSAAGARRILVTGLCADAPREACHRGSGAEPSRRSEVATSTESPGTVVQSWVPVALAARRPASRCDAGARAVEGAGRARAAQRERHDPARAGHRSVLAAASTTARSRSASRKPDGGSTRGVEGGAPSPSSQRWQPRPYVTEHAEHALIQGSALTRAFTGKGDAASDSAQDLNRLLRHRPRSISRRRGGCRHRPTRYLRPPDGSRRTPDLSSPGRGGTNTPERESR
jgi:hypothetical protein